MTPLPLLKGSAAAVDDSAAAVDDSAAAVDDSAAAVDDSSAAVETPLLLLIPLLSFCSAQVGQNRVTPQLV